MLSPETVRLLLDVLDATPFSVPGAQLAQVAAQVYKARSELQELLEQEQ